MKRLAAILILTGAGCSSASAQPFTVENKIAPAPSQFVVVNRIGSDAPRRDAGQLSLPPIDFDLSALQAPAAPVVAAPPRFQRGSFSPGHACPECGRVVLAKSGRGPVAGSHWHVCPVDRCSWWHRD